MVISSTCDKSIHRAVSFDCVFPSHDVSKGCGKEDDEYDISKGVIQIKNKSVRKIRQKCREVVV